MNQKAEFTNYSLIQVILINQIQVSTKYITNRFLGQVLNIFCYKSIVLQV